MPKILIYISSLIGILFILIGGLLYSFVVKKNHQPQINTVQNIPQKEEKNKQPAVPINQNVSQKENDKKELVNQEKKEEEKKEEEIDFFFIIKLVAVALHIILSIRSIIKAKCSSNSDKDKENKEINKDKENKEIDKDKENKEIDKDKKESDKDKKDGNLVFLIFKALIPLCSLFIKGRKKSIFIMIILKISLYVLGCYCGGFSQSFKAKQQLLKGAFKKKSSTQPIEQQTTITQDQNQTNNNNN